MTVAKDSTISRYLQCGLLVSLAVLFTATNVAAADDAILECAKIEDEAQRLACFDKAAAERPRDNDGGADKAEDEAFELKATVTRCEKSPDNRYFFYLDNGQVWKQTRTERHRYKDCNFAGTIIRDFFGYKIVREDGERDIRVKRVR